MYKRRLLAEGVGPERMDPSRTFGSLSRRELLRHARYLAENVLKLAENVRFTGSAEDYEAFGKLNQHLTAMQMCCSFAENYTLEELMNHNRSG